MTATQTQVTFREAVIEALAEEMARDRNVLLIGEDVGAAGGVFHQTKGLFDQFGPIRVIDTPISEAGFIGMAVGAAMSGLRPVTEVMFGDFITLGMDLLVNQAAKVHWMSDGQYRVPLVVRTAVGIGAATGPQHAQSFHAWFAHVPGLKVVFPSNPADAKALMKGAIRDDNPVIFFEDRMSYGMRGSVGGADHVLPPGQAAVARPGRDISLIALGQMVPRALDAATRLASAGIEAEVIDLRSLVPLDEGIIAQTVRRTNRALVLDPGCIGFGASAEIAARVQELAFDWLDAPVARMGAAQVPVPFSPALESRVLPDGAAIAARAAAMVTGRQEGEAA
ncbi:MAG: alpha-ketoacid dehydrogenase subunit beta [Pararhodobacter sp.]|nr:alpha-ketoacid dehydrogenase subunit beta [Pararhodobacter sp.]